MIFYKRRCSWWWRWYDDSDDVSGFNNDNSDRNNGDDDVDGDGDDVDGDDDDGDGDGDDVDGDGYGDDADGDGLSDSDGYSGSGYYEDDDNDDIGDNDEGGDEVVMLLLWLRIVNSTSVYSRIQFRFTIISNMFHMKKPCLLSATHDTDMHGLSIGGLPAICAVVVHCLTSTCLERFHSYTCQ